MKQLEGIRIIKTIYKKGTAQKNQTQETIMLNLSTGGDLRLNPGETLINYDDGTFEIIRGNFKIDNIMYSEEKDAVIVAEPGKKDARIIDYKKLHEKNKK